MDFSLLSSEASHSCSQMSEFELSYVSDYKSEKKFLKIEVLTSINPVQSIFEKLYSPLLKFIEQNLLAFNKDKP